MKNKLLIYIIACMVLIVGISFVLATTNSPTKMCYQESVNQSNQPSNYFNITGPLIASDGNCGLNYSGSYTQFGSVQYPSKFYNGDWTDSATLSSGGGYFINYTKPSFPIFDGTELLLRDLNSFYYVPIPKDCLNYSLTTLEFLISYYSFSSNPWSCYNGSWELLGYSTRNIAEEAMNWNVSNFGVSIAYPLNNTFTLNNKINVNYTIFNFSAISSIWYTNSSGKVNYTLTYGTNITNVTWLEGVNNVTIYINDTNNNFDSDSVTFTVDTINPQINITYPLNNTNWSINTVDVNYTISDNIGIGSCWYSNDTYSFNTTLTNCSTNLTNVVWSEGGHNVTVWVNDSAGNQNSSKVRFNIDSIPPSISFSNETTIQGGYLQNYIIANVTSSDLNSGLKNITIYIYNSTGLYNKTNSTSSPLFYNFTGIPPGTYYLNATSYDNYGNRNDTETRMINLGSLVINAPIGTFSDINVSWNVLTNNSNINYCVYWIMRGASLEIANTTIICNSSMSGTFVVSSYNTNYNFYYWQNYSGGSSDEVTSAFTVNPSAPPQQPGGGGPYIPPITNETTSPQIGKCQKFSDSWNEWFDKTKSEGLWQRIVEGWKIILNLIFCKSEASIAPIDYVP